MGFKLGKDINIKRNQDIRKVLADNPNFIAELETIALILKHCFPISEIERFIEIIKVTCAPWE